MTKRYDGQWLKVRFEVHQSDLDAIGPCDPQPEGWGYYTGPEYVTWQEATPAYDPFRRIYFMDYEVDRLNYTQSCPPLLDYERGALVAYRPAGPTELTFEVPDRSPAIPGCYTPCWVHFIDPDRPDHLKSFQVFTTGKNYAGGVQFWGYDRTVPPEPPKPCPRCVKRDAKKRDRRRLKELRKRYDQKFANLAQAEAYDDGYHDAIDW